MKNINSLRLFTSTNTDPNPDGKYVLYWMQINRRLEYNYALEYAVSWANKLKLPLLIYEAVGLQNQWGCDRFFTFMCEGLAEHSKVCAEKRVAYYPYIEDAKGASQGLLETLGQNASLVIGDEYPVYIIASLNRYFRLHSKVPYITVDSNGIIPLGITEKAPYSAYIFRKTMQRHFVEAFSNPPKKDPLADLQNRKNPLDGWDVTEKWPTGERYFDELKQLVSRLPINHKVGALSINGTREEALKKLDVFIHQKIFQYGDDRNHPDAEMASGLSPWLHFGKVSEVEIVKAALENQPERWSIEDIRYKDGQRDGFFGGNPSVESFLDEVITWREVGFHFCHHTLNYDKFESLPDWAIKTLEKHTADERPFLYTFDQLENSGTHDLIWNAAQRQLVQDGIIQNYLRMLWGKKILEWSPDPRTALEWMIELNNKWAIDGRDPNSYSGIFWCLGRFDRPWGPERPIFGQVRYMTSDSTGKKLRMRDYLKKYGEI